MLLCILCCFVRRAYALEWTTIVEFIPVPDLFRELDTMKVSNPLINQLWEDYSDGYYANYAYMYTGYNYVHNDENNCTWGAQYCFYINSKFYTYKHTDEFDYRFAFAGFTPFYADYYTAVRRIVFDGSKPMPTVWAKSAAAYKAVGRIRF